MALLVSMHRAPLVVVTLTLGVLGGFQGSFVGSLNGATPVGAGIGAVAGLAWGLAAGLIAHLVRRNTTAATWVANVSLFIGIVLTGVKLGGSQTLGIIQTNAFAEAPDIVAATIHGPVADSLGAFYNITNGTLEWLVLPTILLFNWQVPQRRTAIIAAAAFFYLTRIWTYTYFGPTITRLDADLADGVPVDQVLAEFKEWTDLSTIRGIVGEAVPFLSLLLGAFFPTHSERNRTAQPR
ncbi:MAG: hypothetical protein ACRDT2_18510 [Natronosporangium sp.]